MKGRSLLEFTAEIRGDGNMCPLWKKCDRADRARVKDKGNHQGRVMLRSSLREGRNFTQNRNLAGVKEVLTNSAADSETRRCTVSIHNTPVLP